MSKAFAWGKTPAGKQKEVMTPSAPLTTGKEPKIHHGSSTWFIPSTANGLDNSFQTKSFSEVVKGTKTKENKEKNIYENNKKKVETNHLNKVATEVELVTPMEEINESWKNARPRKTIGKDDAYYETRRVKFKH